MPRGKSARKFGIDLKKFGAVTNEQANTIFKKVIVDLDSRIVMGTPVDEGRARANWFPSLNAPSSAITDDVDTMGEVAVASAQRIASAAKLGDVAWMTNNLPYILKLENGHSTQAPAGMVDLNLLAVAAHYGGVVEHG